MTPGGVFVYTVFFGYSHRAKDNIAMDWEINIKVRRHGDGRRWKDIPGKIHPMGYSKSDSLVYTEVIALARTQCLDLSRVREIRWSWERSLIGHYITLASRFDSPVNGAR